MGAAALTLRGGEYAIHGTNRPELIGGFVSHGCIRMYNADIRELYRLVAVGTRSSSSSDAVARAACDTANIVVLWRPNRFGQTQSWLVLLHCTTLWRLASTLKLVCF